MLRALLFPLLFSASVCYEVFKSVGLFNAIVVALLILSVIGMLCFLLKEYQDAKKKKDNDVSNFNQNKK